jgi:plastocyanin
MHLPKAPELVISVLATGLLVGSGAGLTRSQDGPEGPVDPGAVDIAGFAFGPDSLTVRAGDTITWTNRDRATHTVTGVDGDLLESSDLGDGATYEVTFEAPGSFEYICKFHPNMQGTIVVEG